MEYFLVGHERKNVAEGEGSELVQALHLQSDFCALTAPIVLSVRSLNHNTTYSMSLFNALRVIKFMCYGDFKAILTKVLIRGNNLEESREGMSKKLGCKCEYYLVLLLIGRPFIEIFSHTYLLMSCIEVLMLGLLNKFYDKSYFILP
jgi:hypothetical protein